MVNLQSAAPNRVLLIEDDAATVIAFRQRLTDLGYAVDEAPSALHAIQMLCDRRYAAVVLDVIMPGAMNGFAVISFLETEQPDMLERVVIVSGMPAQTIMNAAPQLLPRFYSKPVDLDKVVATIDRCIREKYEEQASSRR
jgi:DNA-binding NtrC family response regulator